jgi:hypothetical protein
MSLEDFDAFVLLFGDEVGPNLLCPVLDVMRGYILK